MSNSVTTSLNDVNIEAVASLAGKIQQEPEIAATRWNASVNWKGGFRSEARIRDFGPVNSDEPDALGGTDTGPNPVEQVLAALGNCLAVGYAANATASGIELKDLSIELEGDLDLHTFLGLASGNAGYDSISVKVKIDSDATRDSIEALHEKVTGTSPVGHTLSRAVPLKIDLV
ncbi:MAG: OsmC family protein [Gammaproteobacteria bacterium]|nr:OsmC family protein [Gammaproteobacteria bacterium]